MTLTVRIADTPDTARSAAGPWSALMERAPGAGVFLTPEWQLSWLDALQGGAEPAIVLLEDAGSVRAALPMARTVERPGGLPVRVTAIGGEEMASGDHLAPVVEPGFEAPAARALETWMADELQVADVLRFASVDEGPFAGAVRAAAERRGWELLERARDVAPFAALPRTWGEIEAALGARRTGRLEYYARRLRKDHADVEVRLNDEAAPLARVLDEMAALHVRLWESRGRPGTLGREAKRRFLDRFCARALERGWLRLHQLWVGPRLVSATLVFHHRGVASYYQSGWDLDFKLYNVGELAVMQGLRRAVEEGVAVFDFLRGDEPYKEKFATGRAELLTLEIASRPKGRLLLKAGAARGAAAAAVRRAHP
ncbi:MAG: GNAT family N-acetyltransferase [Candidatus Eisenbacteria bacterium]|nr:GNAT family N-acetyltransferase [Candidatus Eisenbacteria bacterium]